MPSSVIVLAPAHDLQGTDDHGRGPQQVHRRHQNLRRAPDRDRIPGEVEQEIPSFQVTTIREVDTGGQLDPRGLGGIRFIGRGMRIGQDDLRQRKLHCRAPLRLMLRRAPNSFTHKRRMTIANAVIF